MNLFVGGCRLVVLSLFSLRRMGDSEAILRWLPGMIEFGAIVGLFHTMDDFWWIVLLFTRNGGLYGGLWGGSVRNNFLESCF